MRAALRVPWRGAAVPCLALALVTAMSSPARAADAVAAGEPQVVLDEVLVAGEQPGPGLWKVTRASADGDHVLWILGTYGPLPKRMTWRSQGVEAVIATSQELLSPPRAGAKVGFLGGLTMLPALVGVRNNPDGRSLKDTMPADLYARWLVQKAKYLGNAGGVEKWRPIFAAHELYESAIAKAGLESSTAIWPVVERLARRHRLRITSPEIVVEIEKPRAAVQEFKRSELADLECFARTIERLEADLDLMRARANAWSTGDVQALREMTQVDQAGACLAALMNSTVVRERGFDEVPVRLADAWLAAAEQALARNPSTVAVLKIDRILAPDGYVARLRARGYAVEEP